MRTAALLLSQAALTIADGPCDIFAAGGTPCVAAYSTTRALFSSFSGPLYQVQRKLDNATLDVTVSRPGGFANSAPQDQFCSGRACFVKRLYDQTSFLNHLDIAPVHVGHIAFDKPVNASRDRLQAGGVPVYSMYFEGGMGYRNDATRGIATGDDAASIYMVTSGTHYDAKCCLRVLCARAPHPWPRRTLTQPRLPQHAVTLATWR